MFYMTTPGPTLDKKEVLQMINSCPQRGERELTIQSTCPVPGIAGDNHFLGTSDQPRQEPGEGPEARRDGKTRPSTHSGRAFCFAARPSSTEDTGPGRPQGTSALQPRPLRGAGELVQQAVGDTVGIPEMSAGPS